MQDPELDYKLRRSCKRMIKVCLSPCLLVFTLQQYQPCPLSVLSKYGQSNSESSSETNFKLISKPWLQ